MAPRQGEGCCFTNDIIETGCRVFLCTRCEMSANHYGKSSLSYVNFLSRYLYLLIKRKPNLINILWIFFTVFPCKTVCVTVTIFLYFSANFSATRKCNVI